LSPTKWRLIAAMLGVAVVGGVVVWATGGSNGASRIGPLVEPPGAGNTAFGMPDDVGHAVSVSGPFVLENSSDRPLVLESAALGGGQAGIVLRGAYIVHLPGVASIGSAYGYRVPANGYPVHGATVAPHASIVLVFGVVATKLGRHTWQAVLVTYRDEQTTYTGSYGLAGRICAPKAKYWKKNGCPTPPLSPPGTS
jgi:hypothetical protein